MVFQHDEKHTVDNVFYIPYRHSRQVDLVSGREAKEVMDKDKVYGGEKPVVNSLDVYLESNQIFATSTNHSAITCADIPNLPLSSNGMGDCHGESEVKHARCREEDLCIVPCKKSRHTVACHDPPFDALHPNKNSITESSAAAHSGFKENVGLSEENRPCSTSVEVSSGSKCLEANGLHRVTIDPCISYEAVKWDMQALSCPQIADGGHSPKSQVLSDELFLSLYDRYPRKHVALGPDHQVNVPSWGSESPTDSGEDERNKRLMGKSILAMHDDGGRHDAVGAGGSGFCCKCIEKGSIICIKRHVSESRERKRKALGLERFIELGFHDMGEDVALSWTEEEEQLFHDIVFANPVSRGKNFWKVLPLAFPSRSIKDLVSYYFNVFVLRKRAMQNRSEPWNVDSDNDEWEGSDDGDFTVDDSGQGVYYQSPVSQEVAYIEEGEEEEDDEDDEFDEEEEGIEGVDITCKATLDSQLNFSYKSMSVLVEPPQKGSQDLTEEHDAQDDSCTSYEGQYGGVESSTNPFVRATSTAIETNKLHKSFNEECRSNQGTTCISGSCDSKYWEDGYFFSTAKLDFLPTCHVIEEVLGSSSSWHDESSMGDHGAM